MDIDELILRNEHQSIKGLMVDAIKLHTELTRY